jgi:hypothetical protein
MWLCVTDGNRGIGGGRCLALIPAVVMSAMAGNSISERHMHSRCELIGMGVITRSKARQPMLKIKPLAWEWEQQWWVAETPWGEMYIIGNHWIGGHQHSVHPSQETAQAAAEEWYRAKMMEGLEVATVEELRQAIKELEGGL